MLRRSAGVLCPTRVVEERLEVLLTRRVFYNERRGRLMSFPGEYVFPGGIKERVDPDLESTARREFREEVGYKGDFHNVRFFRLGRTPRFDVSYFTSGLTDNTFTPNPHEVLTVGWDTPLAWLELIFSKEFTRQQLEELGKYGVNRRQIPFDIVQTLELIHRQY